MNNAWFIREDVMQAMQHGIRTGTAPTPAQCMDHEAKAAATVVAGEPPRIMQTRGDVAVIRIEGALTEKPSLWAMFFGGGNATYQDIRAALAMAQSDPNIKRAELHIDSPGGNVNGMFETVAAIQSFTKPITTKAKMACSAAYALAAVTNSIEADMNASCFGSVGVAATFLVWDEEVTVTSTEAPNKRPDLRTEEGKAVVRKELDDIHDLFASEIARGRGVTAEAVNKNFGRGGVVLAAEAKRLGMIDSIAGKASLRSVPSSTATTDETTASGSGVGQKETTTMDLKTLKAQHAEVYEAAAAEGVSAERKRINAHLNLGKRSADHMKIALEAIASGADFSDQEVQSKYMDAAMTAAQVQARQADADTAQPIAAGATPPAAPVSSGNTTATADDAEEGDLGDKVAARLKARRGTATK